METIKAYHSPSTYDCPQSQGSNALFLTKKAHSNSLIEKFLWDHLNKCENGRKSWGKTLCPLNANCSHCVQDFKTETLCLILHLAQNGRASIVQARGAILYSMICYTPCIIVWIIMFCKASQKKSASRLPHLQLCSWNVDVKMNIGDDRSFAVLTLIRWDLDTVLVWDEIRRRRACSFTTCFTLDYLSRFSP